MRFTLLLLFALLFSGCISKKNYEDVVRNYEDQLSQRLRKLDMQQDSMLSLRLALERSRGGNDMLLITQTRLQDRLMVLEDELDELRGNLTSTNFQMSNQLAGLRQEKREVELSYDSLLLSRDAIINNFQRGVDKASNVIRKTLDGTIPDESFSLSTSAGEVILSVQEDLLFKKRTTDELNDDAEYVLRAVMDALQSDPLLKLTLVGHTDNQPNPRRNTNNWQYAAQRATYLAEEFANTYYLSPNRVVAASHGEFGPARSNSTSEGQRFNRRVDFILRNNVGNLVRDLDKLGAKKK